MYSFQNLVWDSDLELLQVLGVDEKVQLANVKLTKYHELRMRCRALKHRTRDRLRDRKFELTPVERSARRQMINGMYFPCPCAQIQHRLSKS